MSSCVLVTVRVEVEPKQAANELNEISVWYGLIAPLRMGRSSLSSSSKGMVLVQSIGRQTYFFRICRRATLLWEVTGRDRFAFEVFPRKARRVALASLLCLRLVEAFFWILFTRVLLLRTNFFPST